MDKFDKHTIEIIYPILEEYNLHNDEKFKSVFLDFYNDQDRAARKTVAQSKLNKNINHGASELLDLLSSPIPEDSIRNISSISITCGDIELPPQYINNEINPEFLEMVNPLKEPLTGKAPKTITLKGKAVAQLLLSLTPVQTKQLETMANIESQTQQNRSTPHIQCLKRYSKASLGYLKTTYPLLFKSNKSVAKLLAYLFIALDIHLIIKSEDYKKENKDENNNFNESILADRIEKYFS